MSYRWNPGWSGAVVVAFFVIFPALALVVRRKWKLAEVRKAEVMRLVRLAAAESERAEMEAAAEFVYSAEAPDMAVAGGEIGMPHCAVCFSPTTTRCSRCKVVRYCSGSCQIIHWRQGHKYDCHPPLIDDHHKSQSNASDLKGVEGEISEPSSNGLDNEGRGHSNDGFYVDQSVSNKWAAKAEPYILVDRSLEREVKPDDAEPLEILSKKPVPLEANLTSEIHRDSEEYDKTNFVNAPDKGCSFVSTIGTSSSICSTISGSVEMPADASSGEDLRRAASRQHANANAHDHLEESFSSSSPGSCKSSVADADQTNDMIFPHTTAFATSLHYVSFSSDLKQDPTCINKETDFKLSAPSNKNIFSPSSVDARLCENAGDCTPMVLSSLNPEKSKTLISSESYIEGHGETLDLNAAETLIYAKPTEAQSCHNNHHPELDAGLHSELSVRLSSIKSSSAAASRARSEYRGTMTPVLGKSGDDGRKSNNEQLKSSFPTCPMDHSSSLAQGQSILRNASARVENVSPIARKSQKIGSTLPNGKVSAKRTVQLIASSSLSRHSQSGVFNYGYGKYSYKMFFPYDNFIKLYNSDKVDMRPCGMVNCGNSCYANSVLQCLAFTRPLAAFILEGLHAKACPKKGWCFTCEFETLLIKAKQGKSPLSPTGIISHIQDIGSNFSHGREEDAHEFLRFAIDAMQSSCLKEAGASAISELAQETTLIQLIFGGYLRSKIKCMRCQGKSEHRERMMDLTVDIHGDIGTLEEALARFTASEVLEGENKYKCDRKQMAANNNSWTISWNGTEARFTPPRTENGEAPPPLNITFGQDNVRVQVPEPTPAEALALSASQKREARAQQAQQKERKKEKRERAPESPIHNDEIRKSVFSRLTFPSSRPTKKAAVSRTDYSAEAGPSGVKMSRRQRRNRNRQLAKQEKPMKARVEASHLTRNPFYPLSKMEGEMPVKAERMAPAAGRKPLSSRKGKEPIRAPEPKKQLSLREEMRRILRDVKMSGLRPQSQRLIKQLVTRTKDYSEWCPPSPSPPRPKSVGVRPRNQPEWCPQVPIRWKRPMPTLPKPEHQVRRPRNKEAEEDRSPNKTVRRIVKDTNGELQVVTYPLVDPTASQARKREEIRKGKQKWVVKAKPDEASSSQNRKALSKEEALQEREKQKEEKVVKKPSTRLADLNSEEEMLNWMYEFTEEVSDNDCPVVSIHMAGTRAQTHRVIDEETRAGEENDTSGQGDLKLVIKEKDQVIGILNEKLDEALKSIERLTLQITKLGSKDPGSSVLGNAPSGSRSETNNNGGEHQGAPNPTAETPSMPDQSKVDDMVNKAVTAALAASQSGTVVKKGRPYPAAYEAEPFPPGFSQPSFRTFDGTGNPRQHIAQYRASCGLFGGNQIWLLRLFVTSLEGVAFTWYSELPNGRVKSFDEMEDLFLARFASAQQRVNIGDLVLEKRKYNEDWPSYIIRWRNLAMQCEPQLSEKHSVELVLNNIDGPLLPFLRSCEINTFQRLLDQITRMLPAMPKGSAPYKETQGRNSRPGKPEARIAQVADQKGKMKASPAFPQKFQRSMSSDLAEKLNKPYSFTKESTKKIFHLMVKLGLQLPEPRRPHEVNMVNDPNYCVFHRCLGHTIENCYVFKDMVEKKHQSKEIVLSSKYLLPSPSVHVIQMSAQETEKQGLAAAAGAKAKAVAITPVDEEPLRSDQDWRIAMSKSTKKVIRRLEELSQVDLKAQAEQKKAATTAAKAAKKNVREKDETNVKGQGPPLDMKKDGILVPPLVSVIDNKMKHVSEYLLSSFSVNCINDSETESEEEVIFSVPEGAYFGSDSESATSVEMEQVAEVISPEPEVVDQVVLRGGKVLPPQQPNKPKDTGKQIETRNPIPSDEVPNKDRVVPPKDGVDYNVLAHLKKLPALLSIYDALLLSPELRESLVSALLQPTEYGVHLIQEEEVAALALAEPPEITFSKEDFLLGKEEHNRPLYVTAFTKGTRLNRILVDPGASVNVITVKTLAQLPLDRAQFQNDVLIMRGFNDKGERALGSVTIPLQFQNLQTEVKFFIIDAKTSYKALLGRPWIHKYGIIPSTLHQCMKYVSGDRVHKIWGDIEPFTIHEINIYDHAELYFSKGIPAIFQAGQTDEVSKPTKKIAKFAPLRQPQGNQLPVQQTDRGKRGGRGGRGSIGGRGSTGGRANKTKDQQDRTPPKEYGLNLPRGAYLSDSSDEEIFALPAINKAKAKIQISSSDSSDEELFLLQPKMTQLTGQMSGLSMNEKKAVQPQPKKHAGEIPSIEPDFVSTLFFVPPRKIPGEKPIWFHSAPSSSGRNNVTEDKAFVNEIDEIKIDLSWYSSPLISNCIMKGTLPSAWNVKQAEMYERMWNAKERKPQQGLGYNEETGEDGVQTTTCLAIETASGQPDLMEEDDEGHPEESEVKNAPQELEEGVPSVLDDLKEINLGTEEEPRPTYVSALLTEESTAEMKMLLMEFKDCFAWNYTEMPGLDPEVAVHRLAIQPEMVPVKQSPRRMRLEIEEQVITEVKKLIDANFIREEKYPTWLANVVPVKKKNGQIRICIDFRDLNKACPKDDFPLPVPELMIDIASSHSMFSFMDGSSGYNQIKMAEDEQKFTAFRTPIGVFCYKVMPFGLKNAGATYQRAMTHIFDGLIHKQVECYVDDLVVKSKLKEDHLYDLRIVFKRLRQYNLKMNPLKCAFGVTAGKFLGFVVRHRGIEIDPSKIKAIQEMPPPKSLTQLRSFQGKVAYLRRFISNLSGRCQPFAALMKKDTKFKWDQKCQEAFENIKQYLTNPPVLAAPIPGKPLILYTTALEESVGALLAQENEERKENALYYLSKRLIPTEVKYPAMEKQCLALIFAVQKLRHYLLSHKINLISRVNPLQYLMTRPTLSGRLARWSMILLQYDITYIPQRAVKGQALADFLAAHPLPADSPLNDELPDEQLMQIEGPDPEDKSAQSTWELYFDGAASMKTDHNHVPKSGIGLIFLTPAKGIMKYSYSLSEPRTNNETEYEALIAGLELAIQMNISRLIVKGDSQLIINQVAGTYKVLKPSLLPYHERTMELLRKIPEVIIQRIPRSGNGKADALAKLAKELTMLEGQSATITVQHKYVLSPASLQGAPKEPSETLNEEAINATEQDADWRTPFIEYLSRGISPKEKSLATQIKKRAASYAFINETLYRRSFDQMWLRCLGKDEAQKVMSEVHEGLCGAHQSGPKMKIKIKRMGYYWPSMTTDCITHAKRCRSCQLYSTVLHQPPNPLHPTVASWPFDSWGTDIIGPIEPPSSRGHRFILAATDYFSKWAEAIPLREVRSDNVLEFFRDHVVYRFGVPRRIISDNGSAFRSTKINKFAQRHKIDWRYSTIYYPRANGLAEAFNKTLIQLIKKLLASNKKEWHEKLPEALWAYRTTYRTPTQCTPYALAFGTEAVLPLEVEIPSLRVAIGYGLTQEENARLRLEELDSLDEARLQAHQNLQLYQARMIQAHEKMVRPRAFKVGELVLVLRQPILQRHRSGKFEPNWQGPFVIRRVYEGGAYQLINQEGAMHPFPVNGRFLKKYIA